jgi:hypothetical protein
LRQCWPAAIFLVATGAICAGLVEQALRDILPDRIWSIKPYRVSLLNFEDTKAAQALNPQQVLGDFREATLLDRQS